MATSNRLLGYRGGKGSLKDPEYLRGWKERQAELKSKADAKKVADQRQSNAKRAAYWKAQEDKKLGMSATSRHIPHSVESAGIIDRPKNRSVASVRTSYKRFERNLGRLVIAAGIIFVLIKLISALVH